MKMERSYTLVLLAAGLGTRFGGLKQLEPIGPAGETLMEYSVYDAIVAGFRNVVIVIRRGMEADFRRVVNRRLLTYCEIKGVSVQFAYQEPESLPGKLFCRGGHIRPRGTAHALLSCRDVVKTPFVVLNASDYHRKKAFRELIGWLKGLPADSSGSYCLAGVRTERALSSHGAVPRTLGSVDKSGSLLRLQEIKDITRAPGGIEGRWDGSKVLLSPQSFASVNMWGFTTDVFQRADGSLRRFLAWNGKDCLSELTLASFVDEHLQTGQISVSALTTAVDTHIRITFREEIPYIRAAFNDLVRRGYYRAPLLNVPNRGL